MDILQAVLFCLFIAFLVRLLRPTRPVPGVRTPLGESHTAASHAALFGGAFLGSSSSESPPDCGSGVGGCSSGGGPDFGGGADFGGFSGDCGGGGGDFGGGGW